MNKQIAILTAAAMCAAIQPVCADLVDDFNRTDGSISVDSIGINPFSPEKFSYTERASTTGPDLVNVARIENNALRIVGNAAGATALLQASSPGLVTLTGYNNAYPIISATVAFDQGTLNTEASTIAAANATNGSLTANRIGFILRAPTNVNFNSPGNPTSQGGYIDAQIGPNGDILIRELKSTGTLTAVYSKNPWNNNANTDAKLHAGKLPATINGLPFDVNQDGLLTPNEPFTLSLQIINNEDTGGQDFVEMLINGADVTPSLIAGGLLSYLGGSASGTNGVVLYKNRVAAANNVVSDAIFDDLTLSPVANNTTTTTWNADADGNWITDTNWTNNAPYGLDTQVTFGNVITAPRTVTLTTGEVAGTLNFSSANSYTVNAEIGTFMAGTTRVTTTANLTLASATGGVGINVTAGTHTISSGVVVKNDATVNVVAGSSLLVSGTLLGTGHALTITGGGSVQFGAVRVGAFALNAGGASITAKTTSNTASGTSIVSSLSIGAGLKLDLTNNDLVLDYANGGAADPVKTALVRGLIQSAYAGGAWTGNGLTSSSAAAVAANSSIAFKSALGYAEASAAGIGTFDGIAVDQDAILVRYTYFGDANLDGKVDSADFTKLAQGFNTSDAGWVSGDFNYDGTVNLLDFNMLANNYGASGASPAPAALGALVPEPASVSVLATSLLGLIHMRSRRRPTHNCA